MKALLALCFALVVTAPGGAWAQTYPSHTITIVVPFPAGGSVDALARMIAPKISEALGQPVVVENRSGASGTVGMGAVAKAEPDGYTILYAPVSIAINPALYRKLPFNAEKDFAPSARRCRARSCWSRIRISRCPPWRSLSRWRRRGRESSTSAPRASPIRSSLAWRC